MRTRFPVGPFFGVRVSISLSWLIVLILVVFGLETLQIFPDELPAPGRLLLALSVGGLFLISLACHELAHAYVARRVGLDVKEVGLAVVGTQGELEQKAPTGRGDMAIAIAGPIVSLLIGALAMGVSLAIGRPTDPWLIGIGEVARLVGLSNLVIGVLNLLPGHPFDGGRLLRGAILARTGDEHRAMRLSLTAGRLLSFAMMGVGIALALTEQLIDGIWLVVLGWLLTQSNRLYARRMEIERLVIGMTVNDVMDRDYPVVPPTLTVDALLLQHVQREDTDVYPVMVNDRLLGIVDVARLQRLPEDARQTTRLEEVMNATDSLTVLARTTSIMDALQAFDRSRAEALPVMDEGAPRQLLGMISRRGLVLAVRARRSPPPAAPEPAA